MLYESQTVRFSLSPSECASSKMLVIITPIDQLHQSFISSDLTYFKTKWLLSGDSRIIRLKHVAQQMQRLLVNTVYTPSNWQVV